MLHSSAETVCPRAFLRDPHSVSAVFNCRQSKVLTFPGFHCFFLWATGNSYSQFPVVSELKQIVLVCLFLHSSGGLHAVMVQMDHRPGVRELAAPLAPLS